MLPEELDKAMLFWVRTIQQHEFFGEINALQEQKPIPRNSQILSLNPFIDADGLLRVGGRIHKAPTNYNLRHPVLLPRHSHLTKLIIDDIHMRHYHAGPQLVQSLICQKFWIIRARDAIRHQIRKCVTCVKQRASTMQQQMANLPESRVTPSRPFTRCGVDYAGPFLLKPMLSRSKTTIKSYLCLFVCFSTRALHLELVSSLSTEAFIAALRRFVARRGKPSDIFSDCGTNFIGADRQLRELVALYSNPSHNSQVSDQLSQDGIKWHFNPPGAPSFGGLWEAGVKSVKFHLRRIIGSNRLNFEEMTTIITQVEAVLNSRPITALSSDPSDMTALTPGHFLIGGPLVAAPDQDLTDEKFSRLNRWQMLQQMYQSFWKRWYREFLTRMQQRPKWMEPQPQIQVDDLVIIKEDNLPPLQWKLGRVQDVHPGDDGIVRVVTLRTKDGNLKRPILKLCLLPVGKLEGLTNNSEVLKRPSSVQSGGNDDALNIHP